MYTLYATCMFFAEFFANYGKVMERTEERSNGTSIVDPHVIVPIVSAVICTCAIAVCILIVYKRRFVLVFYLSISLDLSFFLSQLVSALISI